MSALPDIDLSALPADQRDAVAALIRENSALQEINRRLEHLVAELNHVVHGKRSEKLDADDRQLAFEDLEASVAEVEEQRDQQTASNDAPRRKSAPAKRNRGNLPEGLPRIEQVVEPDSLACPCGCGVAIVARTNGAPMATAQDRRGPQRAAGHRARTTARSGHRAAPVCLPRLHRRRHPGARACGPDRERAADRGRHRACPRQQVRGPPAIIPSKPDARPVGRHHRPRHARGLGGCRGVPPAARRRSAG